MSGSASSSALLLCSSSLVGEMARTVFRLRFRDVVMARSRFSIFSSPALSSCSCSVSGKVVCFDLVV
jgi:hypothetical protein